MSIKELTKADFDNLKNTYSGLVLVDYWAAWCGPCRQMNPILEGFSEDPELSFISFAKVDCDQEDALADEQGVTGLPTFLVYHFKADGSAEVVQRVAGAQDGLAFKQILLALK